MMSLVPTCKFCGADLCFRDRVTLDRHTGELHLCLKKQRQMDEALDHPPHHLPYKSNTYEQKVYSFLENGEVLQSDLGVPHPADTVSRLNRQISASGMHISARWVYAGKFVRARQKLYRLERSDA